MLNNPRIYEPDPWAGENRLQIEWDASEQTWLLVLQDPGGQVEYKLTPGRRAALLKALWWVEQQAALASTSVASPPGYVANEDGSSPVQMWG